RLAKSRQQPAQPTCAYRGERAPPARRPRIASGLSGQASALYRCSSRTPRLRTFFIVQDAAWQAQGWAGLRMAPAWPGRGRVGGAADGAGLAGAGADAVVVVPARSRRCRDV